MFKNNNKDTRTTSLTLPLTTLFLLLTLNIFCTLFYCYKFSNQTNKCHLGLSFQVINLLSVKCEKYIVLWAGTICWATNYHPYSPKIRLQKDNSLTKNFHNRASKSQTLWDRNFRNKFAPYAWQRAICPEENGLTGAVQEKLIYFSMIKRKF